MTPLPHEVEEGLDISLGYQIFDLDHDRAASRLQIESDCRGVEFLQRIGLGLAALAKRKQNARCGDEQQGPAEPSSAQVSEWFSATVPHTQLPSAMPPSIKA
ncbi:hypothetical protein X737_30545 [Mesorhizobium sp. L48C026A00]|nr:hypothetical protein X737_30545 [Mesorhizobium sp. L48C026A00]